jgi:hypothetical protein
MADPYARRMKMLVKPVFCACLAGLSLVGSVAARAQDSNQEAASQRRLQGNLLPVREIERRVVPRMPGAQYLGFDYEPSTGVYTLKFLRNGSVIWVDADGRTGNIIRRTGD